MKFKNIKIQNFMSVGDSPIEIDFESYQKDKIVFIQG